MIIKAQTDLRFLSLNRKISTRKEKSNEIRSFIIIEIVYRENTFMGLILDLDSLTRYGSADFCHFTRPNHIKTRTHKSISFEHAKREFFMWFETRKVRTFDQRQFRFDDKNKHLRSKSNRRDNCKTKSWRKNCIKVVKKSQL